MNGTKMNKKYTYKDCINAAMQCKSRTEFKHKFQYLYELSHKKHWIDNFEWLTTNRKNIDNKYEYCLGRAKLYEYSKDFKENEQYAYSIATKNKWLNDYTWLKSSIIQWTDELCFEYANQCITLKEFREKYSGGYIYALKHNLLEQFSWLKINNYPKNYWKDEQHCLDAAKQCKSRMEFKRIYSSAYYWARKNGWINNYDWFEIQSEYDLNEKTHCVYIYEDTKNKVCYIGRTKNIKRRSRDHKYNTDSVKQYFDSIGQVVPSPRILATHLTAMESRKLENEYIEQYKNNGWILLNKAATGEFSGSLGSCYHFWSKEKCIEIANNCETIKQLRETYICVYEKILKHPEWKKQCYLYNNQQSVISKPRFYWTEEQCEQEAKKYKSKHDFLINGKGAVKAARKNGWIENYKWNN